MRKKTVRRFAEGTKVAVTKTQVELTDLLSKNGAKDFGVGRMGDRGFVAFVLGVRHIRMHVKIPDANAPEVRGVAHSKKAEAVAQLERERWRRLLLLVKAKLEWVALGESTIEEEFLAHLLVNGQTVGEILTAEKLDALSQGSSTLMLGPARYEDA